MSDFYFPQISSSESSSDLPNYADCVFPKAVPSHWNTPPLRISECDSPDVFKSTLKTSCFRTCFSIVSAHEQSIWNVVLYKETLYLFSFFNLLYLAFSVEDNL